MVKYVNKEFGKKVFDIIEKEFDGRLAGAVINYLFDKGIENVKEITDEDIAEIPGNGLMTANFSQALVRTAREIAKTCDLYKDIFPFITCELPNAYCQTKHMKWYKEDFEDELAWQKVVEDMEVDTNAEDVKTIQMSYVVNEYVYEEKPVYIIQSRKTGDRIDYFGTLKEAEEELKQYENEDIMNGEYTPDFYEIVNDVWSGGYRR